MKKNAAKMLILVLVPAADSVVDSALLTRC